MVSCLACGEQNAKKNCFCAGCGRRIRPVGRRLEQDVLTVIAKLRRKNRGRNLTVIGVVLGGLGFFGYGWVKQKIDTAVVSQIEAMKPGIVKEANAKAEELFNRELPKVMAKVANDATHMLAADLRQVGEKEQREIEEIYEDGKQEARTRTQQQLASYENSKLGVITPAVLTVGSFVTPSSTLFLDSMNSPRAVAISDSTTLGTITPAGSSAEFLKMLKPPDSGFQITSTSSIVTTQTLYTPSCIGGLVADASGTLTWKSTDCNDKASALSVGLIGSNGKSIQ
jgi:hypothetical protein